MYHQKRTKPNSDQGKTFPDSTTEKGFFLKIKTTENRKGKGQHKEKKPEGIRRYLQAVLKPFEKYTNLFPILKSKLKLYENIFHLLNC